MPEEMRDQSIECVDCKAQFVWTVGEQEFWVKKGLKNTPRRCRPCRGKKRERYGQAPTHQPPKADDHLIGQGEE